MSLLRWLAWAFLLALFVSDFGFNAWAKPVPREAYGISFAVAVGIDVPSMRNLFLQFLRNLVGTNENKNQ